MLKRRQIIKLSLNCFFIVVIIVALIVGTNIAYRYETAINTLLSPPIVDEGALEQSSATGQEMSKRIVEEGTVLLKNNGTLPLDKSVKQVNVFGWRSVDWIYGSEGFNASGGVAPENDDFSKNVDIYKALNAYGVQYNKRLYDMYYDYIAPDHQSANLRDKYIKDLIPLRDPKISDKKYYSDDLLSYSAEYSDVAIVVIGRMAGEAMNASTTTQIKKGPGASNDDTRHYLEISAEEEELLTYVGATYDKVIVLLNMSNPFECGFLDTIPGIDACMYLGFTGTRGAAALPSLLYGDVSPSGKTVDVFPYDMFTNPGNVFLDKQYTDSSTWYMDIVESVYVGYKWYETADAEGVWDEYSLYEGDEQRTGYDAVVQFPLGHGLSYTTFDWNVKGFYIHDDELGEDEEPTEFAPGCDITAKAIAENMQIDVVVNVKNTGLVRGRDVVEVYLTAPYTPGEVEKASVSLIGFNKTNILEPQADEDITITLDLYDFASYDCYGLNNKDEDTHTGYELDAGTYTLSLRTDSHIVKDVIYKDGETTQAGSFDYNVAELINIDVDPVTGSPVDNLFTGEKTVDTIPLDASTKDGSFKADIPWFTREAFVDPTEWAAVNVARAVTPGASGVSTYTKERAAAWDNATVDEFGEAVTAEKPTWGKNKGLKVAENGIVNDLGKKLGADYYAEEWDALLDQVTIAEFTTMTGGYYGTQAMDSVGKPYLSDLDGPAQIKGFNYAPRGTGYPTMVTVAQSWSPDLAYEFGKSFGDDMKSVGVMGVWGWAIDSHRSAFFGRNHESPSEDAYLAGRIITNAVKGLNTRGRYCFLKHFAVYGYGGENIWMSEQCLREIYIKPFRMAFVEGGALGCMTTYQGLGAEHSETTIALLTGVLRKEWKFNGAITTDYIGTNSYCDSLLRCGGNLGMGVYLSIGSYNASSSARLQQRMRESVKQVLYTWLRADHNERMYLANPDKNDTIITTNSIISWSWWQPLLTTLIIVVSIMCAMWLALLLIHMFVKPQKKERAAATAGEDRSVGVNESAAVIASEANVEAGFIFGGGIAEPDGGADSPDAAADGDGAEQAPTDDASATQASEVDASAEQAAVAEAPKKKKNPPVKRTPEERAQLLEERASKQAERAEMERARAELAAKKAEELIAKAAEVREKAAAKQAEKASAKQAEKKKVKKAEKAPKEGNENE